MRAVLRCELRELGVDGVEGRIEEVGYARAGPFAQVVEEVLVEVVAAPLGGVLAGVAVKNGEVALST